MNFKELFEGAMPKLPGAVSGIKIMTPQQFVSQNDDVVDESYDDVNPSSPSMYASEKTLPVTSVGNKERQFRGAMAEETNPHTSALGRALHRDLSKEKKASPAQVQRG